MSPEPRAVPDGDELIVDAATGKLLAVRERAPKVGPPLEGPMRPMDNPMKNS